MDTLHDIAEEIRRCTSCPLWKTRTLTVSGFSDSDIESQIDSIEAVQIAIIVPPPTESEDRTGILDIKERPLTQKLVKELDLPVFVTPIIKCTPCGKIRLKKEIEACDNYLYEQLDVISPNVIIFCGDFEHPDIEETYDAVVFNIFKESEISDVVSEVRTELGK